jgi:hypothetical protein
MPLERHGPTQSGETGRGAAISHAVRNLAEPHGSDPDPTGQAQRRPLATGETVKKFTIRVPDQIAAGTQLLTEIEGTSVNQLIVDLLAKKR